MTISGFIHVFDIFFLLADIDECEDDNGGCPQRCVNQPGAYSCQCAQGFHRADNGSCVGPVSTLLLSTII